ncbi:YeeE/YedE family protein [Carboxydothermus ferrireducens]|uniref:Sulphur transport domain-containing protein n=1 Tax=Carboxydothermus ferrireducens DSM 11255 TaxID=1119529 RepID=A0ABX2R6B3_9THEO|nr:YeeE/YedE family protein [Carboxydothermus ferrireducens]NYE56499.1 hypothetical protein [Carboxydothermus ferrireducens DSM 11255]
MQTEKRAYYLSVIPGYLLLIGLGIALSIVNPAMLLYYFLGMGIGFAMQKSRICVASAFNDLFLFKNPVGMKNLFFLILFTTVVFGSLQFFLPTHFGKGSIYYPGPFNLLGGILFGFGMVWAGGCAGSTLVRMGEGQLAAFLTFIFMFFGTFLGTYLFNFIWEMVISFKPVYLPETLGWLNAILLQLFLIVLIILVFYFWEKKQEDLAEVELEWEDTPFWKRPWPYLVGALFFAVFSGLIFYFSVKVWRVNTVFSFWGLWLLKSLGINIENWKFLALSSHRQIYENGFGALVFNFVNFGVIAGGFLASSISGEFRIRKIRKPIQFWGSILGGFLMGIGARLSFGCSIGAFIGGIASFSLHGWLFFAGLLVGAFLGTRGLKYYYLKAGKN